MIAKTPTPTPEMLAELELLEGGLGAELARRRPIPDRAATLRMDAAAQRLWDPGPDGRAQPQRQRSTVVTFTVRGLLAVALVVICAVGVTLIHDPSSTDSGSVDASKIGALPQDSVERSAGSAEQGMAAPAEPGVAADVPAPDSSALAPGAARQRELAGSLSVQVRRGRVEPVAQRIIARVDEMGGIVMSTDISRRSAQLSLRVPAAQLDTALREFSAHGRVSSRNRTSSDVTARNRAQVAEARRLRRQIASLSKQLGSAGGAERDALRAELDALRAQLAGQQGLVDGASERVRYALLDVQLGEIPAGADVVVVDDGQFGASDAWRTVKGAWGVIGAVLVLVAAIGVPVALALGGVWWAVGRMRRARAQRLLDGER